MRRTVSSIRIGGNPQQTGAQTGTLGVPAGRRCHKKYLKKLKTNNRTASAQLGEGRQLHGPLARTCAFFFFRKGGSFVVWGNQGSRIKGFLVKLSELVVLKLLKHIKYVCKVFVYCSLVVILCNVPLLMFVCTLHVLFIYVVVGMRNLYIIYIYIYIYIYIIVYIINVFTCFSSVFRFAFFFFSFRLFLIFFLMFCLCLIFTTHALHSLT